MARLIAIAFLMTLCATARPADVVRRDVLPLDVRVVQAPTWIAARDGRHALYELHIANYGARTLTLESIDVMDGYSKELRQTNAGEALLEKLLRPGLDVRDASKAQLGAGQTAVVFLELKAPPQGPASEWLAHRITVRVPQDTRAAAVNPLEALDVLPTPVKRGPVVLGPVLAGGRWVAANGLSNLSEHRRALTTVQGRAMIAQRYAIDFVQLGDNGRLSRDDGAANESWFGYGADVLAAADGAVVDVQDGIAENRPMSGVMAAPVRLDTLAGNYVLLDIGDAYVLYGHLKPGSIRVRIGEKVQRGQVLAGVGNSGQSDAPHLHVHVVDRPAPLAAEGAPFVFEVLSISGRIDDLDAFIANRERFRPAARVRLERAAPLSGDVVEFGGARRGGK